MELSWLEDLIAVAHSGNFTRAAELRNVSQPTFSRRVKHLEEWVGAPLVERDTHRVRLTPAGQEFLTVAEEVVRRLVSGRNEAREIAAGSASTLRLACTHALSLLFLPAWLPHMEEETDEADVISLVTDTMSGCESLLLEGSVQFLLCHHHPSAQVAMRPGQFRSIEIGHDILRPVCVPKGRGMEPLFALPGSAEAPLPYLAYSASSGMGRIIAATQALDGPHAWLSTVFTSHVAAVLTLMAKRRRGLAWLPVSMITRPLAHGTFVPAGDKSWDIPISIRLYRSQTRQSPAAEGFWKRVQQFVTEHGSVSAATDPAYLR